MIADTNSPSAPAPESGTIREVLDRNMVLEATQVRQDPTGTTWAAVRLVTTDGGVLAYDEKLNVGHDSARRSLAHSAFECAEWQGIAEEENYIRYELDNFCLRLREMAISGLLGEMVAGDPDIGSPLMISGNLVYEDSGFFLVGLPGDGKSWLALLHAVAINAGVHTVMGKVRKRKVLFVNLERSKKSMRYRLARANVAIGLGETLALAVGAGVADTESFGVGVSCVGTGVSVGTGGSMPENDRSST